MNVIPQHKIPYTTPKPYRLISYNQ